MNPRQTNLKVLFNAKDVSADIARDITNFTYTDCASDVSDDVDITLNAQDNKWVNGWMPEAGTRLTPELIGKNWRKDGDERKIACGLFYLDDRSYGEPAELTLTGVARPANSSFSTEEIEKVWQYTTLKKIGEAIAKKYGLKTAFEGTDISIETWEQKGTDGAEYNKLCTEYGFVMKVYSDRIWVYDREMFKAKKSVRKITPADMARGTFSWKSGLLGTYTGGKYEYSNQQKKLDISVTIGTGPRMVKINKFTTSEKDARIRLAAEINNANHGSTTASFDVLDGWDLCSGQCIDIEGKGSAIDGKYFIDKVVYKLTRSGGLIVSVECSKCLPAFGTTAKPGTGGTSGSLATGKTVSLNNAPFYISSDSKSVAFRRTGTYYIYDGIQINGRYRITNTESRCGKLPIGQNVTGWVPAEYCK